MSDFSYSPFDAEDEDAGGVFSANMPSYMLAAGNHSTGNLNDKWAEENPDASLSQRAYLFAGSSVASAINSFRNTAISVGNIFREEDQEQVDTKDMIADFDENMAAYYDSNREAADLVGFIGGSFIPGMAGVKVFNAGSKALMASKGGVFGRNMADGLGILPGARQQLVAKASKEFATSRAAFSLTNANTVRAMAAGFGENILQSAAFEVAVAATMNASPILDDMDVGDLVGNIVTGALVGGAIGGVIDAARSASQIKTGIKAIDTKLTPLTQIARGADGTRNSDSLLIMRNDLDNIQINPVEGIDEVTWATRAEDKRRAIETDTRKVIGEIAGGNQHVADLVHAATKNSPTREFNSLFLNLDNVSTISGAHDIVSKAEGSVRAAARRAGKEIPTNTIDPQTGQITSIASKQVKYLRVFGDGFGDILDDAPAFRSLTDGLAKGQTVDVTAAKVKWGKNTHEVKVGEAFDSMRGTVHESEARHMWANDPKVPAMSAFFNDIANRAAKGTRAAKDKLVDGKLKIYANDLPMLGKAYREGFTDFVIVKQGKEIKDKVTGKVTGRKPDEVVSQGMDRESFLSYIAQRKDAMSANLGAVALEKGGIEFASQAIAKRLDVTEDWLTGAAVHGDLSKSIFGLQAHRQKWWDRVHGNTPQPPEIATMTPWKNPNTVGMVYDTLRLDGMDPFTMEAMTIIKQRQKLQEQTNHVAAAKSLGNDYNNLPEWSDSLLQAANRMGSGPSFISFANGNYGSLGSFAEYVGSLVTKWTQGNVQKVGDAMASVNYNVVNDRDAAVELASVFAKIRNAGSHKYVIHDNQIMLKSYRDHLVKNADNAAAVADDFDFAIDEVKEFIAPPGVDVVLNLQKPAAFEWIKQHVSLNANRVEKGKIRNAARGLGDNLDAEAIYPPLPSPERFTHHAFVTDDSIRGTGHTTMLYAPDAKALELQMAEARKQGFTVLTKSDTAAYFRAKGEYEYSKGFNENYIDSTLARSGASAPHFPITGTPSEMVQDWMQWHVSQENIAVRDAVSLKYSRQLGVLSKMSEAYESINDSTRKGFFDKFKSQVKNPFNDYAKTLMGVSRQTEYPVWKAVNDTVSKAFGKVVDTVSEVFSNPTGGYDYEAVNKVMANAGLKVAATEAQLQAWAKHPAGQSALTSFISKQNAILSALTLRLDPVNALNNAVGSTILTGAEVKSVQRAIREGNTDAVGQLAELMSMKLPGVEDVINSPGKLIASAYADILGSGGSALIKKYKGQNLVVDQVQQFRNLLETVTIDGTETAAQLNSKLAKAEAAMKTFADAGERWTGNKFAEQMNRAVSARIMDKITQVAVNAGVMDSKTASTYINTFVNRTQANIIASQRPQMFQGPVGQAIGLFQSYQFNIMQQLLRHVGEGHTKDAITLLGLQSTVYGAAGMPGFQAINTHVIGNASGNTDHKDLYSAINGVAGKSVGDWLTYGLASNIFIHPDLKINLYSRGDINPRSLTIVPTSLAEMPIAGAWTRAFNSASGTLKNISGGGDVWQSILTGVEQQGISRPMKGLAQVLRGIGEGNMSYSASASGNVIAANDFYSLANLARLSGAKPFDEAVAQDAMFRVQSYQSKDRAQRESLGSAIRTVVGNGHAPSPEQMEGFMSSYAKIGGTQTEFSKWYVDQLKSATTPQVNKIIENTGSPYSRYMQEIMGGRMYNSPTLRAAAPLNTGGLATGTAE